jgi:Na+(H+)/acetate symporter ActP
MEKDTPITVDSLHERIRNTESWKGTVTGKLAEISGVVWAVIVVLALGFITLLITVAGLVITYQHDSQDVYQQARDATDTQNDKIEDLLEELRLQRQSTLDATVAK